MKDGEIIDETEKRNFNVEEMDVAAYRHEDGSMRIFYSEYPNSQGYRLYRDNNDNNFGGRQNSLKTYMHRLSKSQEKSAQKNADILENLIG